MAGTRLVALLLSAWICASACGAFSGDASADVAVPSATATAGPDAFERSGRATGFQLTLPPPGSSAPYPLVVALHSLFHNGEEPKQGWGLDALATAEGIAVVYPNGVHESWNAGNCCEAAAAEVDDVAWLRSLIAHIAENFPVDRRRVYLVGFSNGGMLAYRYACQHGDELAGLGVVAGSLQVASCAPPAPVNIVAVHGLADQHVPYDGTHWSAPLQVPITSGTESLTPFRVAARCSYPDEFGEITFISPDSGIPAGGDASRDGRSGTAAAAGPPPAGPPPAGPPPAGPPPADTAGPAAAPAPPIAVRRETACSSGATVVEYLLPRLGHTWPTPTGPEAFDTARVIWSTLEAGRSTVPGPRM